MSMFLYIWSLRIHFVNSVVFPCPAGAITKDLNTEEKCIANAASNKWNADKNECYILGSENNATTRTEDKKRG